MEKKYRLTHYFPLFAIFMASALGFILFSYDQAIKYSLTIATGFAYFVWGIVHHYLHKDLDWEIAIEYFVICIFGVSAVFFLVN